MAYQLDTVEAAGETGEKTADAVLVARIDERSVVVFIELKTTLRPRKDGASRFERAFGQLDDSVEHFHPSGRGGGARGHGDEHHDAFANGQDPIEVLPTATHDVLAVAVTFKQVPRNPPLPPRRMGGRVVLRAAVQASPAHMNRAEIDLQKLLHAAGWR